MRHVTSREGRAALSIVPSHAPERSAPSVAFCSHCGTRPASTEKVEPDSRVCRKCGLGLLLESSADVAPEAGQPFLVLDSSLSVCAVSAGAEKLLATCETDAVHRHISELIAPAYAEPRDQHNLAMAVTWAARGDQATRKVIVRPANTFGIRLLARIAPCGPPRGALLVFE